MLSTIIAWYDSPDYHNRTHSVELWLSKPDAQRGQLFESRRRSPADVWAPATKLGSGYSRASAAKYAHARMLMQNGYPAVAGTQKEAIERTSPAAIAELRRDLEERQRADDEQRARDENDEQRDYAEERFNAALLREE